MFGASEEAGPAAQWCFTRVLFAKTFGWTLDYIDSLSQHEVGEVIGVLNGINKVENERH